MADVFEIVADKIGLIMEVAFGIIVAVAIVRTLIKSSRGESIEVPPVGVLNDLPGSVTGINRHNDISDRNNERSDNKTE